MENRRVLQPSFLMNTVCLSRKSITALTTLHVTRGQYMVWRTCHKHRHTMFMDAWKTLQFSGITLSMLRDYRRRLDALSGMAQTASFQPKGMDTAKPLGKAKKMKDTHTLRNNTIAHTMEHMSSFRQVLDKDTPKGTWAMRDCLIP